MKNYRRYGFIYWLLKKLSGPFIKYFMNYSAKTENGPLAPTIIIANHNTNLDPVLVALSFSRHMFFLASEHTFRKGLLSRLLLSLCAPIPINKSRDDISAIKEMLKRIKAGSSICFFAEGNRSFTGVTWPIVPATAKLVKTAGVDLITFRLEGGYFSSPRWAKYKRKGKITGTIVGRYTAESLKSLSNEDVLHIIERDIYEDAYEKQKNEMCIYRGKNLAEHLETALYLCPACHRIGTLYSQGAELFCACGLKATYSETGFLTGEALPFSTITAWALWQYVYLPTIILSAGEQEICADEEQLLFKVVVAKKAIFMAKGKMYICKDNFYCAGNEFPLHKITRFAIVDQMTLLFSLKEGTCYEIRSMTPRSALKYLEIFNYLRN
ncbi:MAG: 1-acyl-sn-glycerol-3-phosphate acyltransferase [Firmicutes bacterium]|nr:1-acyl-sn-glycerol-3-phosphate acyltransferase [Bacillota bacterium]